MAATNDGIAQLETTEASSSGQETMNSPKSDVGSSRPFFRKFTRSKSNSRNMSPTRKTSVSEHQIPVAVGQIERSNGNTGPSEQDVNETGQTKSKSTKATVSAIAKLKSLGGKKTKKEKLEFPPSSWGFNESNVPPTTTPANATDATSKPLPPAPTQDAALAASEDQQTDVKSSSSNDATPLPNGLEQPEETISLARRIQVLLASIPLISSGTTTPNPSKLSISQNDAPTKGANDAPDVEMPTVPPAPTTSAMINDSRLMSLLSSASIMNGSLSKGKESVFAALDRLGIYSGPSRSASGSNIAQDKSDPSQTQAGSSSITSQNQITPDDSSDLMLYGPLIPDRNSKVEIARSEIVSLDEDENGPTVMTNGSTSPGQDKGRGKVSTPSTEGGEEPTNGVKKGKGKEKVVWVPSRTELSLQCTWWGYRIYLPPPVLVVLNSKQFEAAKQAALITTALKWLLDHIPIKLLPPQFRPAMILARRLVPLLGCIGTFIAWSWGAVKAFDKGNGVVLSATWLMPIAIIPGTWDVDEVTHFQSEESDKKAT